MRNPYEDLGIGKEANADEIKAAYRKKVKDVHPDKEGGGREEFDKVQNAYMVLKDPEKREHYDKHGKEKEKSQEKHFSIIATLFEQLLAKDDLPYNFDYVKTIKASLVEINVNADKKIKDLEKDIAKYQKLKNKFKRKSKKKETAPKKEPNNFFKMAIEARIRMAEDALSKGEELKVDVKRALELMEGYEFEVDKTPSSDMADSFGYMFINRGPFR